MTFDATAEVGAFEEAVEWFRNRFPVTEALLEELGEFSGARAWTIAAVSQLNAVLAAHEVLTNAIATGQKLETTVEQLASSLEAYGFSGSRLAGIARTNVQLAYNAGRYKQLTDPDLVAVRPYRQFDGIADFRQSDICQARDGTTLRADDPWWLTNWPPLHHNCRSTVRSLAEWETEDVPLSKLMPPQGAEDTRGGFGLTPDIAVPWQPDRATLPEGFAQQLAVKDERAQMVAAAERATDSDLSYLKDPGTYRADSLRHFAKLYEGATDPESATAVALKQEPIVVDITADGQLRLTDGRHRWLSARVHGARRIPATIRVKNARERVVAEYDSTLTPDDNGELVGLEERMAAIYREDSET